MNSTSNPELTALDFATGIMLGLASLGIRTHNPTTHESHEAAFGTYRVLTKRRTRRKFEREFELAFNRKLKLKLDIRFLIILGDYGSGDWDDAIREFRHNYGLSWGSDGTIYLDNMLSGVVLMSLEDLPLGVDFWRSLARVYLEALHAW